ncbi:MAG: autotransporter-associated beta strand repeat-containing protein [Thermoguttaceae bacterium]
MKYTKYAVAIAAAVAMLIGMQTFTECRGDDSGTLTMDADSPTCLPIDSGTLSSKLIMNADSPTCLPISGDYTGTTTINAGSIVNNNVSASALNTASCGTLTLAGTATNNAFQPVTVSGATLDVSGASSLVKSGAGTLVLNGANTFTGATTVYGGTLQIGNSSLGTAGTGNITSSTVQINNATFGGTLNIGNAGTVYGATTINAGRWQINNSGLGTLQIGGSGIVSGATIAIGGSGGVIKSDTGTWTLSGAGATVVNGGTLQISNPSVVVVQPVIGAITLGGNGTYTGPTINAGTLQINNASSTITLSNSGLTKIGPGSITLGNTIYTGSTINSGTLQLGNISGSGALTVAPGILTIASGTLTLAPGTSILQYGGINDTGVLTNSSCTFQVLSGTHTVGNISGIGNTILSADSNLTASSVVQNTLTIGAGATLTIAAIPGGPIGSLTPLYNVKPIPEPSVMVLLSIAVLAFIRFGLVPKNSAVRP